MFFFSIDYNLICLWNCFDNITVRFLLFLSFNGTLVIIVVDLGAIYPDEIMKLGFCIICAAKCFFISKLFFRVIFSKLLFSIIAFQWLWLYANMVCIICTFFNSFFLLKILWNNTRYFIASIWIYLKFGFFYNI